MSPRLGRFVPIAGWLPGYQRAALVPDLLAGLTVWALLVPEAMAYADLAGMPPETGLYAGFGALVTYALFTTSRQVTVGPSSTVAILSAATVAAVAGDADPVQLSITLALIVGAIFVVAGVARFGFVSVFLSPPVMVGFTFGLGVTIAVGQLDKLFGIEAEAGNVAAQILSIIEHIGDADGRTTVIGVSSLVVLLVGRAVLGHRIPVALGLVALTIALSVGLGWEADGVHVVGEIPAEVPSLTVPDVGPREVGALVPGAIGIVLVAFAEGYGAAQSLARRHGYRVDADREMIATGAANLGSGLLGGFTVDGSLSRSSAADEAGARTQMAMLLCAAVTLVTIWALTPLFEPLPEAVLGAIVIAAVTGTFRVGELRRIRSIRAGDFAAALAALLGVCGIGILAGLAIAVGISFVMLVYRASRPNMPRLGIVEGQHGYVATTNTDAIEPAVVVVIRLDAPLFFANAEAFHDRVAAVLGEEPRPSAVVVDLETVNFVDTGGADGLGELVGQLEAAGIGVAVARLNQEGRAVLDRAGVAGKIGAAKFHPSVEDAVVALERDRTGATDGTGESRPDTQDDDVSLSEDDANGTADGDH